MQTTNTNNLEEVTERFNNALDTFNTVMRRLSDGNKDYSLSESLGLNHLILISESLCISAKASVGYDVFSDNTLEYVGRMATTLLRSSTILGDTLQEKDRTDEEPR